MESDDYRQACEAVAAAFVASFPDHVTRHLGDEAVIVEAAERGRRWLEEQMSAWVAEPPGRQRSSPLELFRQALAFPTEAASATGRSPADRDEVAGKVVPGDLFDIAPMTSRDIGDDAWQAHVRWGLARTRAVAGVVPRPAGTVAGATAVLVGTDLMDRSKVEAAADGAGYDLQIWRNPGAVEQGLESGLPAVAFVDLGHPAANDVIRRLTEAEVRVIAFGPHVDDHALAAAKALGASEALARSVFFRRLSDLFPAQV